MTAYAGSEGNYLKADPEQKLIFLTPGWIKYFNLQQQKTTEKEKPIMKTLFNGFNGIILLNTTGNLDQYETQIQNFIDFTGLKILETRKIEVNQLKKLINQVC